MSKLLLDKQDKDLHLWNSPPVNTILEGIQLATLPENLDPQLVEKTLIKMFAPEWLRDTAKRVKYVQRERKVDPFILFWVLVLSFGAGVQRSLASLRRAYEKESSETIVSSAFYDRFSEGVRP
jgi:hypothetical protein